MLSLIVQCIRKYLVFCRHRNFRVDALVTQCTPHSADIGNIDNQLSCNMGNNLIAHLRPANLREIRLFFDL